MAKKKRNITGLRNQPKLTPSLIASTDAPPISNSDLPQSSDAQLEAADPDPDRDEEEWCPNLQFDSCKPDWDASDTEDDIDSEDEQDFLDSKEKHVGISHGTHGKGRTVGCTQAKRSSQRLEDCHDAFGCRSQ